MKAWLLIALTLFYTGPAQAQQVVATPLPNAKQTFLDSNGHPLNGGKIFNYVPGTFVPKTTWSDTSETIPNTNPVTLDTAGRASIWGQGSYRQIVKDANGNTVWDAFTTAVGSSVPTGATGQDTAPVGSIMTWAGFTAPLNWAFPYGQTLSRTLYPELLAALTITNIATNCVSGSPTLTGLANTSQMRVGKPIEASCVPVGTTIAAIPTGTTLTVSNNATLTGTVTSTVFSWGNGDGSLTFTLPDLRGLVVAGADAMGGTAANNLTSAYFGTTAATPAGNGGVDHRTVAVVNLPAYTLPNTLALVDPGHTHGVPASGSVGTSGFPNNVQSVGSLPTSTSFTGMSLTGSVTSGGSGTPLAAVQPTITANYIIKIKPNTSGAGGVTSLGGLFGDIAIDTTMRAYVTGGANYIGLATQNNNTMLANTSGGVAAPVPTTVSAWLDSAFGASQGSLIYRDAANWSLLGPGANGLFLKTLGPGTNPAWSVATGSGTVTSVALSAPGIFNVTGSPVTVNGTLGLALANQSANTIFAGPSSGSPAAPTFRALTSADIGTQIRTVTAAGVVTVTSADYVVCINKTVGAATTVNLPGSPPTGQTFIIKDCKGDAATNNITVTPAAGTIDGAATYLMNLNRASATVVYNGAEWSLI